MTPSSQTVCLCMIVKDEAPVIRRCLDSVRPLIDHWIIVDTGSTDGTQEIVRECFGDIPGRLVERPWKDFAHNRSEALALARLKADYSLIIDADDDLQLPADYRLPKLDADSYTIDIHDGPIRYRRPQLVRNALAWQYRGVLHEFLICEGADPAAHLPLVMCRRHDGARRLDPQTYRKDAALLEHALKTETDAFLRSRYTFYLAQSYRDCGEHKKAVAYYLERAEMGFWDQEVYVALLQAGRIQHALGESFAPVLEIYERAIRVCPLRAEAFYEASKLCRLAGENLRGAAFSKAAMVLAIPPLALFSEPWIYEWGARDEYVVNSYWADDAGEALDAALEGLAGKRVPDEHRSRFIDNARHAAVKLRGSSSKAASAQAPSAVHALAPARDLQATLPQPSPRVLLAILAKQKESVLPFFLRCIEQLDYPKSSIVLYIRTNNNTDRTADILSEWAARIDGQYASIEFDDKDITTPVQNYAVHEWNSTRFKALAYIRDVSLGKTAAYSCHYYFTVDCDNFVRPSTLRNIIATNLPIVSPLLRHIEIKNPYSNFHSAIDGAGYFREDDTYRPVLLRHTVGLIEVPVVHCTYAVRADVIPRLGYTDGTERHEYVIFSDRARRSGVAQYLDNRQVYGYLTLDDADPDMISEQLRTAQKLMDGR